MTARLLLLIVVIGIVATAMGQNQRGEDPEDFYAGIRQGKLSIQGLGYYTILNTTYAGGDFSRKASLIKIEPHQVTLNAPGENAGQPLVVLRNKITAIVRVEGAGK